VSSYELSNEILYLLCKLTVHITHSIRVNESHHVRCHYHRCCNIYEITTEAEENVEYRTYNQNPKTWLQCLGRRELSMNCFKNKKRQLFILQLRTTSLRLIVQSWLDVPTFATRRLHACHHTRAPSDERWKCGQEMSGNFAKMPIYTLHFMGLLHAVKLRHGTDRFTFLTKEGVLRIFPPKKSVCFDRV
jgi:hypothetical protein